MTERTYSKTQPQQTAAPVRGMRKPGPAVHLQRVLGNQAILRLIQERSLQAKLTVSQPDDAYEREADRVAEQVMCMPERPLADAGGQCACGSGSGAAQETLQAKRTTPQAAIVAREAMQMNSEAEPSGGESAEVSSEVEQGIQSLRGGGNALPDTVRGFMEPRFGADFGAVRVHTGGEAAALARSVQAHAFTVGQDIVFAAGQYAPHTGAGQRLLAHELTHVVQQCGSGEIARQAADGGTPASASPDAGTSAAPGAAAPPAAAPPTLSITRQGATGSTFVSTDTLSFTAQVSGAPNAAQLTNQVSWTVHPVSTDSGGGNPHTATNKAQFSFVPNPTNRPQTGSRAPNAPIEYRVEASVAGAMANLGLQQDEADIIRQEYVDFSATPPGRGSIVAPAVAGFNTGNYSLVVDNGFNAALTATQAQFQQLTQAAAAPPAAPAAAPGAAPAAAPAPVPAVSVISAYRNPRRNVAAGSNYPVTSRHVWGTALDLAVDGANATLWQRLRDAGANAGYSSICEDGPTKKQCSDTTVDHVHIQW